MSRPSAGGLILQVEAWSLGPSKYLQEAVRNVKDYLSREYENWTLDKQAATPFAKDYHPELDITTVLEPE
jgi:hypothetical protein